jgi:cell division protein ZapA
MVQLRVGGQTYRVVSSVSEDELQRLAVVVDRKLAEMVPPGRNIRPENILLAAMSLAHDLEAAHRDLELEKARSSALTERTRGAFGRMLERVDSALGTLPAEPAALPLREP